MKIKIFLFHRVSPERDLLWDPISPERFDNIIRNITKKYFIIPLENHILDSSGSNIKTKKPLAAIVFDDGYKDFIDFALPILQKYNCPCSMYVVTDCVTNQLPPWTYILDYHFIHSKKFSLKLNQDLLPANLRTARFKDLDSRLEYAKRLKSFLKSITNSQRVELYGQTLESLNDVAVKPGLIMNWENLKTIKDEGVEIGSHSLTHPLLAKLDTETEIINEIKNSGEAIQKHLGHFPKTISYPIGSYNEFIKQTAKACGYKLGLAVNQITYDSKINDHFEIPRIEIYNESFLKTYLRLSGLMELINNFRKR